MFSVLSCFPLPNPDNGLVFCGNGWLYSSECQFFCDFGFNLLGNTTTQCLDDHDGNGFGEYTNTPPLCQGSWNYCLFALRNNIDELVSTLSISLFNRKLDIF